MIDHDRDPVVDVAVRRYMTKVVRRWVPGLSVLAVIAAVFAYLPADGAQTDADLATGNSGSQLSEFGSSAPGDGTTSGGSASGSSAGPAGGGSGGGAAGPAGGGDAPSAGGAAGAGEAGGPSGTAKSGVACAPGVRQVEWSAYAAPCVPAFSGDNGGATSPGVTADQIRISYRNTESAAGPALQAATNNGLDDSQTFFADLEKYFALFNSTFETYGREVVLVPYQGQGDALEEAQGRGQAGAQADAATAKDLDVFADVSVNPSQLYAEALTDQQVVSFGVTYMSQQWFESRAPYAYSQWTAVDRFADFTVNMVCKRMANQNAVWAGDAVAQRGPRKFGLMVPENPIYSASGDRIQQGLEACGSKVDKRVEYQLNISTAARQASSAMAQMRAAGVTTVICACDPVAPVFFTNAADAQGFNPEWYSLWWGDSLPRLYSENQWRRAISSGGTVKPLQETEAYAAFKLASNGGEPSANAFGLPYQQALMLFNAIQAAGPNLTATTMAQRWLTLPPSEGDMGPWAYDNLSFAPKAGWKVGFWNPNAVSGADGEQGAWITCGPDVWIRYNDPAAFDPAGTQLPCFGS